jgi:molecular chaperone Hsp33
MKDYAIIAHAFDKTVRIYACHTTQLVEDARLIHQTWPTATAALGRFLSVSVMMGLMYKNDERLTLRIKGDGPVGQMLVEANTQGEVRGEIQNPEVYIVYEDGPKKNKLNVGQSVGKGFLHVTKDLGMKDFFTSSSELQTGEIADDFTYYFAMSEQTPSSVGLGVLVDKDQSVLAAGGYILQLMPDASSETISKIESIVNSIDSVTEMFQNNKTPEDIIDLLSDGNYTVLDKKPLKYYCPCSKESFVKSLSALDDDTLDLLIYEDQHAEIECHFCRKVYDYSQDELKAIKLNRKK